ncbi:MAG: hypothetical protein ABEK10_00295 [Candidatus Nanosalina sp.]
MKFSRKLRDNITDESVAYGYTLTVWGSGALLISSHNINPHLIMSYVIGGVTGFAALALLAFRGFVKEVGIEHENNFIVASMIHILASFGTVAINYLVIGHTGLQDVFLFALIGVNTTLIYNIMLMAEYYLSKDIYDLEKRLSGGSEA